VLRRDLQAEEQELNAQVELAEVNGPGCRGGRDYRDPGGGTPIGRCGTSRAGRRRGSGGAGEGVRGWSWRDQSWNGADTIKMAIPVVVS
jgi:hypothetical protein